MQHPADDEIVRTKLGEYSRAELRHVASEWHSGQWSAFYAFSSSGTAIEGLESEAARCIHQCEDDEETDKLRAIASLEPEYALDYASSGHATVTLDGELVGNVTLCPGGIWKPYIKTGLHVRGVARTADDAAVILVRAMRYQPSPEELARAIIDRNGHDCGWLAERGGLQRLMTQKWILSAWITE